MQGTDLGMIVYVRCVCMCVTKACKQDISRTVHWIHTIYGTKVAHGPYMCLIVFGDDVMHINEWAGLNAKIWKWSYFNHCKSVLFHNWYSCVVS